MNLKPIAYILILLSGALGIAAYLWLTPFAFHSTPHPAISYEEAIDKFILLEKSDSQFPLSQEGHSRLFSHGTQTERVYVLLHGLTSCPEQFVALGTILFNSGANVVIPRAHYAGFSDLLNKEQGNQSGQDLLDQAATGLDIAAGLGKQVTLIGISAGALAATWMAEYRTGIDQVLLISPFFGIYHYSTSVTDALSLFLSHGPNFFIWKDPTLKTALPSPPYDYPRYGTRCLGSTLELSEDIRSFNGAIKTRRLDILISSGDQKVNNRLTKKLTRKWSYANPGKVSLYEFPRALKIPHNSVDPNQPQSNVNIVYPKILEILRIQ
ncbi:MAG: hypothetical protein A3F67_09755 [Verrucomicrobia bacterium RIFCSPHIGHO2_12_FULL_41_10]|nr:MAG: hypothetical protein A3F67_09755 [Verrucomicrobia bacterium RIFCSPHIGHO2_12_FULL_41_10]